MSESEDSALERIRALVVAWRDDGEPAEKVMGEIAGTLDGAGYEATGRQWPSASRADSEPPIYDKPLG